MKVTCATCGEELLGAVNRCWRCGTSVALPASDAELPPIRRTTVVVTNRAPTTPEVREPCCDAADENVPMAELLGSPTAGVNPLAAPATSIRPLRSVQNRPSYSANTGGAVAALVLGGMSFLFSYFTSLALVPAAVGLSMGIWGMYSTRRGTALVGVVLCCIALTISGFNGLVDLYTLQYGHTPWATPDDFEIYDDVYFDQKGDL